MTRETRIGLLVGLGFIIMFGLVLSELTGKTSPPRPEVAAADKDHSPYPWTPVVDRPSLPAAPSSSALAAEHPSTPDPAVGAVAPTSPDPVNVAAKPPDSDPPGSFHPDVIPPVVVPPAVVPPSPPAAPKRTYAVQAGDTLIKIAKKFYGADNAAQYKLILQANREALKNETSLAIGQSLVIPDLPAPAKETAVAAGGEPGVRTMTVDELRRHLGADSSATPGTGPRTTDGVAVVPGRSPAARTPTSGPATSVVAAKTYVVRRGDSLAKIARLTMKDDSPAAIQRIMAANRISDPHTLQVGLKLEIPRQG